MAPENETATAEAEKPAPEAAASGTAESNSSLKDQGDGKGKGELPDLSKLTLDELRELGTQSSKAIREARQAQSVVDGWEPKGGSWEHGPLAARKPEPAKAEEAETATAEKKDGGDEAKESEDGKKPVKEAEAEADAETEKPKDEEEGDDDMPDRDDKGRFVVRKARWDKTMSKAKKADFLEEQLRELTQQLVARNASEKKEEPVKAQTQEDDPQKALEARVQKAREAVKKAKEVDFDAAAELAAIEDLTDAKAELAALKASAKVEQRLAKTSEEKEWSGHVRKALGEQRDVQQSLWDEDVARFAALKEPDLDLRNSKGTLYKETQRILTEWDQQRDPRLVHPRGWRIAVENAAALLGVEIPPIQAVQPVKPKSEVQSKTANPNPSPDRTEQLRKNQTVIQGSTPGSVSNAATSLEEYQATLAKMKPAEALRYHEEMMRRLKQR